MCILYVFLILRTMQYIIYYTHIIYSIILYVIAYNMHYTTLTHAYLAYEYTYYIC